MTTKNTNSSTRFSLIEMDSTPSAEVTARVAARGARHSERDAQAAERAAHTAKFNAARIAARKAARAEASATSAEVFYAEHGTETEKEAHGLAAVLRDEALAKKEAQRAADHAEAAATGIRLAKERKAQRLAAEKAAEVVPGKTIVESARKVAANERAILKDVSGIDLSAKGGAEFGSTDGGLIYDEGTAMLDCGVQVALNSRAAWDKLPTAKTEASRHNAVVEAEERKDYSRTALKGLILDDKGLLTRANGGLRFTDASWGQFRAMAPRGVELRNNFNTWLPESTVSSTLRTRRPDRETQTRELYAAVSRKYAVNDGHKVLNRIAEVLPAMTRARVDYDPETTRLEADLTLHNPYEMKDDIAVGRLHRLGVRYTTRDNGGERHRIRFYGERIACINCTLIPFDIVGLERVHVGSPAAIWTQINRILADADNIMGEFARHWEGAHMSRIVEGAGTPDEVKAVFGQLVDGGFIDTDGTSNKVLVTRLMESWSTEPGYTYQAVNRAVTRAAHGFDWSSGVSDDLEDQAGQLLYQRVSVLNSLGLNY